MLTVHKTRAGLRRSCTRIMDFGMLCQKLCGKMETGVFAENYPAFEAKMKVPSGPRHRPQGAR